MGVRFAWMRLGWTLVLAFGACVSNAQAAPEIVSLAAQGSALPGGSLTIAVVARDDEQPISAVSVRFPGEEGTFAESACRVESSGTPPAGPFSPGREVRAEVPYRPATPGVQLLEVTVASGGCDQPVQTVKRALAITVTLPEAPALPLRHAVQDCPDADTQPTAINAPLMRAATLCLLNRERTRRGLRLLHTNRRLRTAALRHSRDMLRRRYFAHSGPGGPSLESRLARVRYWPATAGEDLGQGNGGLATPRAMVDAWMRSDGHRANILYPGFRQIGLGILPGELQGSGGATYTADFGRR